MNKKYNIKKLVSNNLRFYRNKKNLSQLKLAEMINISPNYYNALENCKYFPSSDLIASICENLDIYPYQLFLESNESYSSNTISNEYELNKIKLEICEFINQYKIN